MSQINLFKEMENFRNQKDNNSKIECLWNILYDDKKVKSMYNHIIHFLIEYANEINKIFKEEEKNKDLTISKTLIEKINEKLEIFTSLNSEYLALNEFFNGIFEQLYNRNNNIKKKKIKNIYTFEELVKKDISELNNNFNLFFIEGTIETIINIDINYIFNLFNNFKVESLKDKNILNNVIFILCHFYILFSNDQRKKIREKYLNYFNKNNNSIIGNIIFPLDEKEIFFPKFPIDENELVNILQIYKQSKNSIFILFYFFIFTEKFFNEECKSKIIFFLLTIMKSFRLEEDNLLYNFYYLKKFKETSNLEIKNENIIILKDIFSREYMLMYNTVLNNILSECFVIPKKLKILEPDNLNFIFGLIKLYYINEKIDKKKLKTNLIKLEKEIYIKIKESNQIKNGIFNKIIKDKKIKSILLELQKKLNTIKSLNSYNYKLKLYPFGSITQGLGNKNSDLDTYLEILKDKKNRPCDDYLNKPKLLNDIYDYLKSLDPTTICHITKRLCLFSFTYENLKIDINYYGIGSVIGSNLLLKYSIIDSRFPILAIFLKEVLNKYNIKNDDNNKNYLNSFSWMCILLCFLQDIIEPPILPKLLNNTHNNNDNFINILVGGGIKGSKKLNFEDVIKSEKSESFYPINFKEIDEFIENKKFISQNKMTVSEIFLMFCKFIGFYFYYHSICVNCSFEFQGFVPKRLLQENTLRGDVKGKKFFQKVIEKYSYNNIYIREPFDHTYNPAKSVTNEKMDFIIKQFKNIYFQIVNNGTLF